MHAIHGFIELKNGLILPWLQFIDGKIPYEQAKQEAVRIKQEIWKNVVVNCYSLN